MIESNSEPYETVTWQIIPRETPYFWRHCSGCGEHRSFYTSDKFRINANGKQLDVWLIYRCSVCDTTWNREIFSRTPVNRIDPTLFEKIQQNHGPTAASYAFDVPKFRNDPDSMNCLPEIRVESKRLEVPGNSQTRKIVLCMDVPCHVRLDRLLATGLNISRSCLLRWYKSGSLWLCPDGKGILKKPAKDGQIIMVST